MNAGTPNTILGARLQTFRFARSPIEQFGIPFLIGLLVSGVLWVILLMIAQEIELIPEGREYSQTRTLFLVAIILFAGVPTMLLIGLPMWRGKDTVIAVHEGGLFCKRRAWRWHDIHAIARLEDGAKVYPRIYGATEPIFIPNFSHPAADHLLMLTKRQTSDALLKHLIAQYDTGHALYFGNFILDQQGVQLDQQHIAWSQIASITAEAGITTLRQHNGTGAMILLHNGLPNAHLLDQLLAHALANKTNVQTTVPTAESQSDLPFAIHHVQLWSVLLRAATQASIAFVVVFFTLGFLVSFTSFATQLIVGLIVITLPLSLSWVVRALWLARSRQIVINQHGVVLHQRKQIERFQWAEFTRYSRQIIEFSNFWTLVLHSADERKLVINVDYAGAEALRQMTLTRFTQARLMQHLVAHQAGRITTTGDVRFSPVGVQRGDLRIQWQDITQVESSGTAIVLRKTDGSMGLVLDQGKAPEAFLLPLLVKAIQGPK